MRVDEDKIVKAAYTLFKRRGIRVITMQEVAQACDSSVRDINLIFKSKQELVLGVVRHVVNKKTAHLLIGSSLAPSAVTELNTFFKVVDETLGTLGFEILEELKDHPPHPDQLRDVIEENLIPYLKKNIQRGIYEGFYREGINAELHASMYFNILLTVLESGSKWTQIRIAVTHINDIFLHGVLNSKGMRV